MDTKNIKWMDALPEHIDDVLYYVQVEGRAPFLAGLPHLYWYGETLFHTDGKNPPAKVVKLVKVGRAGRPPKVTICTATATAHIERETKDGLARQLSVLLQTAYELGFAITVECVPQTPLAMGNHRMVGHVRGER